MFSDFWDLFGFGGPLLGRKGLKLTGREGWHWPPAGKHRISRIQKVETLIFAILGLKWLILNKFGRNSSFTRQVGLIIASSRSGTCFSCCLTSSTHFSITKKSVFFLGSTLVDTPLHSLQPISGACSIEKYPSLRMANRYTRIVDAGWS